MDSDLLTVSEAAELLRLKVSTIRAWVHKRKIPYAKLLGGRVLILRSDVEALIKSSIVEAVAVNTPTI